MWARVFAFVAVVFAIVTTVNAVNKGGDARVFFEGGRRFLNAEPDKSAGARGCGKCRSYGNP